MPRGFTMVETLITLAVLALVAGAVFPFYKSFENNQVLSDAAWRTVSMARQAQLRAMTVVGDSAWGIAAISGQVVLFKGDSYAARDPSADEIFVVDDEIIFSGDSELVFAKLEGAPSLPAGIITLTSENGTITLNFNEKGVVDY